MANTFRKEDSVGATSPAAIKKGKWSIGLDSSTAADFFSGVGTPWPAQNNGWTIYQLRTTNGLQRANIRVLPNSAFDVSRGFAYSDKLANFFNHMGYSGSTTAFVASLWEALDWVATSQNDIVVSDSEFPNIVTDQLGLAVDSYFIPSCPGPIGSRAYDMSGNQLHFSGASFSTGSWGGTANPKGRVAILSGSPCDTPSSNLLNTDTHSIYVILRFKSTPSYPNGSTGGWEQFMGYFSAGSDRSPGIWRFPSQRWVHWTYDPGNTSVNFGKDAINGSEFDLNRDYAICMVKDGGTAYVYVNGIGIGSASVANPKIAGDSVFRLYNYYTAGLMEMSRVLVYRKALSAEEVTQNYYQQKIVTENLSHRWDSNNIVSFNAPHELEATSRNTYDLKSGVVANMQNNAGILVSTGYNRSTMFYNFDGTDDRWIFNTITPGNGAWTVSAWVLGSGGIMGNSSGGPVTNSFGLFNSGGLKIAYFNYDGSWQYRYGNTVLSSTEWYHLTWVNYSNNTMLMFVNGKADSSVFNSYTTNGGPLDCVGNPWPYTAFSGVIQSIQINLGISFNSEQVNLQYENTRSIFNRAIAQRG